MTPPPRTVRGWQRQFAALAGDGPDVVAGTYTARFVGPAPLRFAAPRAIAAAGMARWHGKRFDGRGGGVNLVRTRGDGLRDSLPMVVSTDASWYDARPALVVEYGADAPRPWRWVRDEFRVLDARTLLGLTFVLRPKSRALACPFVLVREQ